MRFVIAALAAGSLIVAGVAGSMVAPVSAQQVKGSHIEVLVCPTSSESGITIATPKSDSIVTSDAVNISGTVTSISQIDLYVDDAYSNTTAVGLGTTVYSITASVSPGTHAIKLVATDSCGQETHEAAIVITYQPPPQPAASTGTNTGHATVEAKAPGTLQAAPVPGPGSGSRPGQAAAQRPPEKTGGLPLVPPFVERLFDAGPQVPKDRRTYTTSDTVKSLVIVSGVVLLAAPYLAAAAAVHLPLLRAGSELNIGARPRVHAVAARHPLRKWRLLGLLLVLLPFLV